MGMNDGGLIWGGTGDMIQRIGVELLTGKGHKDVHGRHQDVSTQVGMGMAKLVRGFIQEGQNGGGHAPVVNKQNPTSGTSVMSKGGQIVMENLNPADIQRIKDKAMMPTWRYHMKDVIKFFVDDLWLGLIWPTINFMWWFLQTMLQVTWFKLLPGIKRCWVTIWYEWGPEIRKEYRSWKQKK